MSKNHSFKVVFQDEVHFQVQTSITSRWAEKGSKPKVMSKPGKESIAYSGYLIPETGELIVTKPGWFNYETVIESFRSFLTVVPAEDGKMYCMVLDNAPWHKKAIRLIWEEELPKYQDIRDKMTYISMPPYSPDLNPIEQVWRITRREMTHNRYFPSRIDLEKKLDAYYSQYRKPNAKLASLCSFKCFRDEQVPVPV